MSIISNLTIAIPVLNEQKNLPKCLDAIGKSFAKKVVLINSGSTDNTLLIAKQYGIDVINFKWNGEFPKKRNWFLRNHTPDTEWVLFLDADEIISEEFKKEVSKAIQSNDYVGYWLKYSRYFMGKKLIGGYPMDKLALFKIGAGEYEKIEEHDWSVLDMEIHEHPILHGKLGKIKSEIEHNDFRGIEHYQKKHIEYAKWEARRYVDLKQSTQTQLTQKQKIKYALFNLLLVASSFFLLLLFILEGF